MTTVERHGDSTVQPAGRADIAPTPTARSGDVPAPVPAPAPAPEGHPRASTFATIPWHGHDARIEYCWVGAPRAKVDTTVVVFLHEGLGSVSAWRDYPDRLCMATGWSGLVFSRRGYGRSTARPADERWAPDFMHEQAWVALPLLFEQLAIAKPLLFGHSDGGSIALLHASRFDVAGVIAVAPHLFVEALSISGIEAARAAYDNGDLHKGNLRARLMRHHDDVDSAFRGWNDIWLAPEFRAWNIEAELASITCPVLAVQGDRDEYGTLEQIHALARVAPQTREVVLADCGHSPHRDQPELLMREAAQFMAEALIASPSPVWAAPASMRPVAPRIRS